MQDTQETQLPSPGQGMGTHSSLLAWKSPWIEEPGRLSPWGCKESDTTEHAHTHMHAHTHTHTHTHTHMGFPTKFD